MLPRGVLLLLLLRISNAMSGEGLSERGRTILYVASNTKMDSILSLT